MQVTAYVDTVTLTPEQRLYLGTLTTHPFCFEDVSSYSSPSEIYKALLFEVPVRRGSKLLSHEEVVTQLEQDTIQTSASVGLKGGEFKCGLFAQALTVGTTSRCQLLGVVAF